MDTNSRTRSTAQSEKLTRPVTAGKRTPTIRHLCGRNGWRRWKDGMDLVGGVEARTGRKR